MPDRVPSTPSSLDNACPSRNTASRTGFHSKPLRMWLMIPGFVMHLSNYNNHDVSAICVTESNCCDISAVKPSKTDRKFNLPVKSLSKLTLSKHWSVSNTTHVSCVVPQGVVYLKWSIYIPQATIGNLRESLCEFCSTEYHEPLGASRPKFDRERPLLCSFTLTLKFSICVVHGWLQQTVFMYTQTSTSPAFHGRFRPSGF